MALVVKDRVKETTTSTGTGTITLAGATQGYQSFSVIGNANTTFYTITDGTNFEVGIGTYTASGTTLSRDTVLESSNSGSLVDFPAGTKDVFVTYPAEKSVTLDGTETLTNKTIDASNNTITNVDLTSDVTGTLPIANGGTNATTAAGALTSLGAYAASNPDGYTTNTGTVTSVATSGTVNGLTLTGGPITGSGTVTLGGTLAISNDDWSGTDLSVANGGTGQSSYTNGQLLIGNTTGNTLTKATLTAGTNVSITNGAGSITINSTDQFSGTVTSVGGTGTVNGLTLSGTVTSSGNLTLGGTLAISNADWSGTDLSVANGGTGASSLTSGYLLKGNGTSAVSASVVYDDGTNIGVGTASPDTLMELVAANPILTIRDTETSTSAADARLRLAESGASDTLNNYWDVGILSGTTISLGFSYNGTEQVRIDSSGNVGLGTASPSSKLHLSGAATADARATFTQTTAGLTGQIQQGSTGFAIAANGSQNMLFETNGVERVRVDSSGNVGIGLTSISAKLHVNGDVRAENGRFLSTRGTAAAPAYRFHDDGDTGMFNLATDILGFSTGGTERARITSGGALAVGTTSPLANAQTHFQKNVNADFTSTLTAASSPMQLVLRDTSNTTTYPDCYAGLFFGAGATSAHWQYIAGARNNGLVFGTGTGSAPVQRMVIESGGDVGINTTNPNVRLEVADTAAQFRLTDTDDSKYAEFSMSSSTLAIRVNSTSDPDFGITEAGSVGIGTISPAAKLHLSDTGPCELIIEADTDNVTETDNSRIIFKQDGAAVVARAGYRSGGNSFEVINEYADSLFLGTSNSTDLTINAAGNITAAVDLRAPIFYDSDDTGYYVNPASASEMYAANFDAAISADSNSVTRITYPGGAAFSQNSSSVTGAIKITLPVSWTNTMMSLRIRVFDYSSGESFEVCCSGYNYLGTTSWVNTSAYILADSGHDRNFSIRFGHDGTKCCILIGETTSTWSYPKVTVEDALLSYSNFSKSDWDDGWSIGLVTSLPTITSTISNVQVGRNGATFRATTDVRAPIFYDSDNTSYYINPNGTSNVVHMTIDGLLLQDSTNRSGLLSVDRKGTSTWTGYSIAHSGTSHWSLMGQESAFGAYDDANNEWIWQYAENSALYLYHNGIQQARTAGGYFIADNQMRAPIYYDSNNTSYYVDPANSGTAVTVNGQINIRSRLSFSHDDTNANITNNTGHTLLYGASGSDIIVHTGTSERLRVKSDGDVGIGTDSPNTILSVRGTGVSGVEVGEDKSNSSNSSRLFFSNATANQTCAIFNQGNHLDFYTNGQIGSTTGAQRMRVNNGNFVTANGSFRAPVFYDSSNTSYYLDPNATGTSLNVAGSIVAAGNVTAYSDLRVKDNVEQIDGALDRIRHVRGVTYNRTDLENKDRRYGGVIAQELEEVLPEAVFDHGDKKSVDYNATIGLLIEAVKELKAEVDELRRDAVTVKHKGK